MVYRIFVRHAHTEVNSKEKAPYWHLSEHGKFQAKELVIKLKRLKIPIQHLFSSEEEKAYRTLVPFSQAAQIPINQVREFGELLFTKYLKSEDEFRKLRRKQFTNPTNTYSSSETAEQALKRFQTAVNKLPNENTVISSHGTVLALYFGNLMELSGEEMYESWQSMQFTAIGIVKHGEMIQAIF